MQQNPFEIIKQLGHGAYGKVYLARQPLLDRQVALKIFSESAASEEESWKRIQREAKIVSTMDHPNIAKLYSFGFLSEKEIFLAMEFVEGKTLFELLNEKKTLPMDVFSNIFCQVCSALHYAHSIGIIHRDIKPNNIMLSGTEGNYQVKVLDFGVARNLFDDKDKGLTKTGVLIGTPSYMSPEQCMGKSCDRRSDIYSLGCVMYESLSGSPPFKAQSVADLLLKHLKEQPANLERQNPNLSLPPSIVELIYQCLSKQPDSRPENAALVSSSILDARSEKLIPDHFASQKRNNDSPSGHFRTKFIFSVASLKLMKFIA